ncbi:MAG: hypothetical protein ACYTEX_27795, partial [Planctomycetota bacterium]
YDAPGEANDFTHEYVYDIVGNRLARNVLGDEPNTTYSYDSSNDELQSQTTNGATISYEYDDNGSLVFADFGTDPNVAYTYDLRGRLAKVEIEDANTVEYLYDPHVM